MHGCLCSIRSSKWFGHEIVFNAERLEVDSFQSISESCFIGLCRLPCRESTDIKAARAVPGHHGPCPATIAGRATRWRESLF